MPALKEMLGKTFGSLTVVAAAGKLYESASYERWWVCECKCGTTTTKRGSTLRSGDTTSCGRTCPYYPRKVSWDQYKHVEFKSTWTMLFKELPRFASDKCMWKCDVCGHEQMNSYNQIKKYFLSTWAEDRKGCDSKANGCKQCFTKRMDLRGKVNGMNISNVQKELARRFHPRMQLNKFVNILIAGKYVDIILKDKRIAIEYEGYYWHGNTSTIGRSKKIINAGFKLWRIKSNCLLPSKSVTAYAINQLMTTDRTHFVTTLKDWGRGPIWHQVKEEKDERRATSLV